MRMVRGLVSEHCEDGQVTGECCEDGQGTGE